MMYCRYILSGNSQFTDVCVICWCCMVCVTRAARWTHGQLFTSWRKRPSIIWKWRLRGVCNWYSCFVITPRLDINFCSEAGQLLDYCFGEFGLFLTEDCWLRRTGNCVTMVYRCRLVFCRV